VPRQGSRDTHGISDILNVLSSLRPSVAAAASLPLHLQEAVPTYERRLPNPAAAPLRMESAGFSFSLSRFHIYVATRQAGPVLLGNVRDISAGIKHQETKRKPKDVIRRFEAARRIMVPTPPLPHARLRFTETGEAGEAGEAGEDEDEGSLNF
jgi:hypothetical protein